MTTTINADTVVGGAIVTADASGTLALQAAGVTKLTVASSGVTLASALPIASGGTNSTATPTAGAVAYGTGSAVAYTAAGTSGQVLTSAGSSAPTWGSAPSPTAAQGASMVLVTSVTASNSATVSVEDAMTAYDEYVLLIDNVVPVSNAVLLRGLLNIGGGYFTDPVYQTTYSFMETGSSTITTSNLVGATSIQYTAGNAANTSRQNINGAIWFTQPSSSTALQALRYEFYANTNSANYYSRYIWGFINYQTAGAMTGLRFYFDTGNISTGNFRLYGIKKS